MCFPHPLGAPRLMGRDVKGRFVGLFNSPWGGEAARPAFKVARSRQYGAGRADFGSLAEVEAHPRSEPRGDLRI